MQKKLLSIILALSLMVQMSPVMAMAEDISVISPIGISVDEPAGDGDKEIVGAGASGLALAGPWDGTTETMPTQDENGIYQIATAAELAWFRTHINDKSSSPASKAVLTADIDLGGHNWIPISNRTTIAEQYSGTFDGQGHTINNLFIVGTSTYQGLFGAVTGATITNLNVAGEVKSSVSFVGGIAGSASGTTIENCSFSGSVELTGKSGYVGGIVGGNQGAASIIRGCVNMADVTGYTAGGVLGYSTKVNTIENCYNTGAISGSFRSGGITGQTSGAITNCYNIGQIGGKSTTPGGIYSFSNGTVANCYHLYPESDASGGTAAKSVKITSPADLNNLLSVLDANGNAVFKAAVDDTENGGYPLLAWQGEQTPPDTTPSISLSGNSTIYVQAGKANETTLLAELKNIENDDVDTVTWSVATAKGDAPVEKIVTTSPSETNDKALIVTAVGGGTATVTATVTAYGETFTATRDVSVIPQITTAEIVNVKSNGAVAMGQTAEVKVSVLGGNEYDYDNYPELTYQWRYNSTAPSADISGATARTFHIPTDAGYAEWGKLYVEIKSGGAVVKEAADVKADLRSEDYGILYPVAYDPNFIIPKKVKDDKPLLLPATHTVDGVTAAIKWTSSNDNIINPTTGLVTRPATGTVEVTLTARFEYGTAFANQKPTITVYSDQAAEDEANKSYLQQAVDSLGSWYGPMEPVYGTDTNIASLLKAELTAKGFGDLTVGVKSVSEVYGGGDIAPNGDITYFYADPNTTPFMKHGQYKVTFTLSKEADTLDTENISVNVHWDRNKVDGVMRSEILSGVTEEIVLADNDDRDNVISNLVLPKVVDGKKWSLIGWSSSDPGTVLVSDENQGTADTLFTPYVGKVIRGEQDKQVTLTAKFNFQFTTLGQPEIALYKTFTFTVPALTGAEADAIRAELLGKLNDGFNKVGIRDYVTGEKLTEVDGIYSAANDLQLPTTRDFGVDGKYFPITITTDDNDTLVAPQVANAARVTVYRPTVGDTAKTALLTVSITDPSRGVSASKNFTIEAQPLIQSELDDALALMDRAKTAYFEGLNNGRYADDFSLTGGLHPFQEAVWDAPKSATSRMSGLRDTAKGELRWIYNSDDVTKSGIVADELDNWAEQEAWRAFRSSDMTILDSETLNHVAQPAEDTFVRVNSTLTHAVYGKYAGMAGYEELEQLSKQPVSVYVMVAGKHHPVRTQAELEKMRDEAIARIDTPISAGFTLLGTKPQSRMRSVPTRASDVLIDTTVDSLEAGTTVFGLFRKALAQQGYTYQSVGSYVKSVTDADGNTLSEGDSGANSGWIYTVNGKLPSIYMNGYSLKEDDEVVVRFTEDYTKEDGFGGGGNDNGGGNGSGGGGNPAVEGSGEDTTVGTATPVTAGVGGANTENETTADMDNTNSTAAPQAEPPAPAVENPAVGDGTGEVNGDLSGEPAGAKATSPSPVAIASIVLVLGAALAAGLVWMKKKQGTGKS